MAQGRRRVVFGVGAVLTLAWLATRSAALGGGSGGRVGGCDYPPPGPPPLPKTQAELVRRIEARVLEANPGLGVPVCDELNGRSCALLVAGALAQADAYGLPVDLVTALAWRESSFNLHIDNLAQRIADGRAIGPLQVRPIAFRDVGMNAAQAVALPLPAKVQYVTGAGLKYLKKLREHYLPEASWCDVLHAYNLGPSAVAAGKRNPGYVAAIIDRARSYSELRTM